MSRYLLVFALAFAVFAADVHAHGGSFRGPNGGVPPGLREPTDPEPPPPPPSDPGDPSGPVTPGDPGPGGPTTPDGGHETPGGEAPQPTPQPTRPGGRPTGKTAQITFDSWRYWWAYNNDDILNLKAHIHARGFTKANPLVHGQSDEAQRAVLQPTRRAVTRTVIPALLRTIRNKSEHEDVHGGALVALGKVGHVGHVSTFDAALWNRFKNPKGQHIDFGLQARESAVLALGLLPNLSDADKRTVREICLRAIEDESLRTRERCWAAVCLGFQRDAGAVRPLLALLEKKYKDDNVPAGILAGLGLIGDVSVRKQIEEIVLDGRIGRVRVSDRVRSFAVYALGKLGHAGSLETIVTVLKSRKFGKLVKRSCAIAAGPLGQAADHAGQERAVRALLRYVRRGGDMTARNFALISLSRIGTPKALRALIDTAAKGRYSERPFAALGLGTAVFYRDRAVEAGQGEALDADLREQIVGKLASLSEKIKDNDMRAAFMLARGLTRDRTAIDALTSIVASRKDATLRGPCCVALGLIGKGTREVKDALLLALRERKSVDLRRDAATGLGLLHDGDVLPVLLEELRRAKSFAVQGQIITAIGTIGDARAIDRLVEILEDGSQPTATRAMAVVGLGMIGDMRTIPELSRLSKDYNYRASVGDLDELLFIL